MDIALLSLALSQGKVQHQASMSVMKKSLDQEEQGAEGLTKMIASAEVGALQMAAQPHLGGNIDLKL
ncbi:YjfB family protein [Cytobacillus spongiae]|uniref:YjfB family protein n=1 Tax=Cytobacillus spongiae TaxID=2901381 RepID=UPI001F1EA2BA|nr:YjfB family protein [Cytobacillus spongiae]UII55610.1 YjfB family protein [Cytobacillus spongiae]